MSLQPLLEAVVGPNPPVAVHAYDGSRVGPPDARTTIVVRRPDALRRLLFAPGELGLVRAYVCGDLEFDGEIWDVLELRARAEHIRMSPVLVTSALREIGLRRLRPPPPPVEETKLRGRRHSRDRDAAAIAHHYDVSNAFYRVLLGPTLTYSCAVFENDDDTLDQAQANKHELICRKLDLHQGERLLDVGCGWGGMLLHAATHHGVDGVGVTLSHQQAELAAKRVADAGLSDRIEIRVQDYRDIADDPFDAVSSIGMFEHVGLSQLERYAGALHTLVRPGGRLLNHGISRPAGQRPRISHKGFIGRYIFPDGELHEVGSVISTLQGAGFEVRHSENLREHYARTLRAWVANLQDRWAEAVDEVGEARARIWLLYLAACAVGFDDGNTQIHQVLAVRPRADGSSDMGLRPTWTGPLGV
jgi:cyclopropane-fatty-acyl-phospholipid synthase